jgi:hypothetical protein
LLLVVALVLALVATGCSRNVEVKPPSASRDDSSQDAAGAQQALDDLDHALEARTAAGAVKVAGPGATDLLAAVAANASSLDLRDLSMRYVDEAAPLTSTEQAQFGADAWSADVQLQYAIGGIDRTPARVETSVVFVSHGGRIRIAGFGAGDARTPLWLVERLSVVRHGETLTAVAAGSPGRYPHLVATALSQVRRTLPSWHGPLVVEVPRSQSELDAALQADDGKYDDIAAVTTTEDGSLSVGAPVRVFVNPAVFDKLADRGAQVVMSHEATHVATGATFVSMPTWLLEGFADYVALVHAGVPVSLAAGQILARIKKSGPPSRLPTSADLDPSATGLGATYEEAWLACRFVAQEYGQAKLIAFYRAVSGGQREQKAFQQVLGTTEKQFVTSWRADLATLAGIPGGA